jgi:signal peptidase I
MLKSVLRWSRSLAEIAAAVLIVMVAKGALAEPFYIPSSSMEPRC